MAVKKSPHQKKRAKKSNAPKPTAIHARVPQGTDKLQPPVIKNISRCGELNLRNRSFVVKPFGGRDQELTQILGNLHQSGIVGKFG